IGYGAPSKLAIRSRAPTLAEVKVKARGSNCHARPTLSIPQRYAPIHLVRDRQGVLRDQVDRLTTISLTRQLDFSLIHQALQCHTEIVGVAYFLRSETQQLTSREAPRPRCPRGTAQVFISSIGQLLGLDLLRRLPKGHLGLLQVPRHNAACSIHTVLCDLGTV